MGTDERLINEICTLLSENLLVEAESPDTDLLEQGVLDSTLLVQLILHLEEYFGLKIELHELEIDELRSIRSIARLVAAKSAASGRLASTA